LPRNPPWQHTFEYQRRQRNDDGSGSDNKVDQLEERNDDIDEEQVVPKGVFAEGIRTIEASNTTPFWHNLPPLN
jgi:hypothetical protein